ncbi:restriction endonuclease subunit S [Campylobacter upsaliensis]|uniref:restriction endonuclease subunit S n=1 Tax=Campylobacter upsaliensis TaxID=28080 RepID=UPI002B3BC9F9|nr:restriction endonuclease subunit S [Campylobacter upsaliensis]MEB2816706.1 restriction endonuclease subunit S [Campylobacter upsaliensis]
MLDFSKVDFNKSISLNPIYSQGKGKTQNPFENCKYELVKLGETLKDLGKGKRPASFANSSGEYNFYKSSLEIYKCTAYDFDTEAIIIGDGGTANIHYYKGKFSVTDHAYIFEKLNDEISLRYIYFVIRNNLNLLQAGFKGIGLQNIAKKFIKEQVKIPLPPLEIQTQIVAECEKVEEQYNTIRMSIEKYQELIRAILVKYGIVNSSEGGAVETSSLPC